MSKARTRAPAFMATALATATCVATEVWAQSSGPWEFPPSGNVPASTEDRIVLRDGTVLRGRVVDAWPSERMLFRSHDGRLHDLNWDLLQETEGPTFRLPPPVASTRQQTATDWLRARSGTVPLVLESNGAPLQVSLVFSSTTATRSVLAPEPYPTMMNPALMEFLAGGLDFPSVPGMGAPGYFEEEATTVRRRVCRTPCRLFLPSGVHRVHLGGEGRRESTETLVLGADGGAFRFRSASWAHYVAGQGLLWSGSAFVLVGSLVLLNTLNGGCPAGCDFTIPVLSLVGGVGLMVGAVPLMVLNRTGLQEQRALTPAERDQR